MYRVHIEQSNLNPKRIWVKVRREGQGWTRYITGFLTAGE